MAYTTAVEVRDELGVEPENYPSIEDAGVVEEALLDRWIRRANELVMSRMPTETDQELLTDVETLVAAHFGYDRVSGRDSGTAVDAVVRENSRIEFATPAGDDISSYWRHAVALSGGRILPSDEPTEDDHWFVSNTSGSA